jgi:hypothetical protein
MNAIARLLLTLPLRRNSPPHARARSKTHLNVESLEDRTTPSRPLPTPMIYAGTGPGSAPFVRTFNIENGFPASTDILVTDSSFTGGVRVASADFTGDGFPDIVAALGPGSTPTIQVFDAWTGEAIDGPLGDFEAFESTFTGGVFVATGDVDGDGVPDIIAGAGAGGGPRVTVFSGTDGTELESFFAFEETFNRGVNVAAADFTGDGKADIIVGAEAGGGPRVRVIDPTIDHEIGGPLGSFFAFDDLTHDGVTVAAHAYAGDVDADGTPDLVVGTQTGPASRVKVYSGADGSVLADFAPFGSGVAAAVSVGLAYIDDNDTADIVVAAQDASGTVRVFDAATESMITGDAGEFLPFDPAGSGVSIAAGNHPYPVWQQPDGLPMVFIDTPDPTASEAGLSTGAFVFYRTGPMNAELPVSFKVRTTEVEDATRNEDYTLRYTDGKILTTNTAIIPAGKGSVAVLVKPIDDPLPDAGIVHVTVTDSVPSPTYTIDEDADVGLVTILNDDPPPNGPGVDGGEGEPGGGGGPIVGTPVIVIGASDPYAAEDGESTGAFTISVFAEPGSTLSKDVTVYYEVSVEGTTDATPDEDYVAIADPEGDPPNVGSVTIPAGASRVTFHVIPFDDDLHEGAEAVSVELLDGGTKYALLSGGTAAAVSIVDNDPLIQTVKWKQLDDVLGGSLDANPNVGGGIRIFAEKNKPDDIAARGQVRVNVQLDKRLPNKLVRLALYDVDDPSANGKNNVVDDEAKVFDNRGSGTEIFKQFTAFTDRNGLATFDVFVSRQPGDNLRAVATIDNSITLPDSVLHLQDDGELAGVYFVASGDAVPTGNATTVKSDLLTVWRKIHIERDHMAAPGKGHTFDGAGGNDDDVNPGGPIRDPDLSLLYKLESAYILPVDDLAKYNNRVGKGPVIPFVRNVEDGNAFAVANPFRDVASQSAFWTVQIIGAYEGPVMEDGDPNTEIFKNGYAATVIPPEAWVTGGCFVYTEVMRDWIAQQPSPPAGYVGAPAGLELLERRIVLHELLHRFRLLHTIPPGDEGPLNNILMYFALPIFGDIAMNLTPALIAHIRNPSNWPM